jgi:hypothetical protein
MQKPINRIESVFLIGYEFVFCLYILYHYLRFFYLFTSHEQHRRVNHETVIHVSRVCRILFRMPG